MAIMDLSSQIFDPIRKIWVKATPEEKVRQSLIAWMVGDLGYPKELMSVEKELNSLPYSNKNFPLRRLDIVCYASGVSNGALYPLLIIECKKEKIHQKCIDQVIGYNNHLGAYFIAVANGSEIRVGYRGENNQYQFISYLPFFHELVNATAARI